MAGALAAALCVASVLPFGAARASAAPGAPAQAARADILGLIGQTPVVEPDGDLVIRLRVSGAPSGSTIRVDAHGAVPTRTDFQASLQGKSLRATVPGSPLIFPATPDLTGTVTLTVPTHDPQSATPVDPARPALRVGEGVYPIQISLVDNRTTIQQLLTYLVRLPTTHEFPPLGVAVVVPVDGPPALQPDGSEHLDERTNSAVVGSTSVLAAHPDVPVTITASGDIVDALDPAVTESARAALASRELALTPYVDLHPSEWLSSGLHDELGRALDRGTQSIANALTQPTRSVYVADDRMTADAARFLHARGVTSMVVPDTALSPLDPRFFNRTLTQRFDLTDSDGIQAATDDTALAAHVGSTGDPVVDANHLIADLAVLYFDDPPDLRAATFVLPDDRAIDSRFLDALLGSLSPAANRMLQPMTLSTMFATIPRAGSRGETTGRGTPLARSLAPAPSDDIGAFASRLRTVETELDSYRTMLVGPNNRADELERRAIVAGGVGLSNDVREAYLDGVTNGIRAEMAKVQPPPRQTINFTARDGVVSLTIKLTTGYPVQVEVVLQGEKLQFPGHEDGRLTLTLTDETTRVPIDVRTRVSGDSPLDVTLQTPDGGLVLGRTRITVRSTAFSGVGIVLSAGAGTFLAAWWARHIIRTRRARRRPRHAVGT